MELSEVLWSSVKPCGAQGSPVELSEAPVELSEAPVELSEALWSSVLGQNLGHPPHRHTPNCAKISARMSCNSFHAIPTIWDHQIAQKSDFGHFWTILALFWALRGLKFGTPPAQTHSQLCQNLIQDVL